ncbi:hypothetical protein GDO81_025648 [Engystomops pustulosus]|uniref:Uncharacterized protein n=1 Tax=Engystomops pustulosus TaxID=76066 RepID=A0AAV6YIM0_ENGPU|nr:hypothetical protein GDO81_025648 [Engystomops pustulosus]
MISEITLPPKQIISAIKARDGKLLRTQVDIRNEFVEYYKDVYSSELCVGVGKIEEVLDNIPIPNISAENAVMLDGPISLSELSDALNNTSKGKAVGVCAIF